MCRDKLNLQQMLTKNIQIFVVLNTVVLPITVNSYFNSSQIMKSPSIVIEDGVFILSSLVETGGIVMVDIPSILSRSAMVLTIYTVPLTVKSPSIAKLESNI